MQERSLFTHPVTVYDLGYTSLGEPTLEIIKRRFRSYPTTLKTPRYTVEGLVFIRCRVGDVTSVRVITFMHDGINRNSCKSLSVWSPGSYFSK